MPSGIFRNPIERGKKISEALRGKKRTPEAIENMRRAVTGIKKSPRSEEHRKKISENMKMLWKNGVRKGGWKLTDEQKNKMSERRPRGEKAWNWKGGITPIYKIIRKSPKYKNWRTEVYLRDNYHCIWGGKRHGNKLVVDHIKPFALFPELRFTTWNGRTLCEDCHKRTPTFGKISKNKFYIVDIIAP